MTYLFILRVQRRLLLNILYMLSVLLSCVMFPRLHGLNAVVLDEPTVRVYFRVQTLVIVLF